MLRDSAEEAGHVAEFCSDTGRLCLGEGAQLGSEGQHEDADLSPPHVPPRATCLLCLHTRVRAHLGTHPQAHPPLLEPRDGLFLREALRRVRIVYLKSHRTGLASQLLSNQLRHLEQLT